MFLQTGNKTGFRSKKAQAQTGEELPEEGKIMLDKSDYGLLKNFFELYSTRKIKLLSLRIRLSKVSAGTGKET